jgi:hypothetical protein
LIKLYKNGRKRLDELWSELNSSWFIKNVSSPE